MRQIRTVATVLVSVTLTFAIGCMVRPDDGSGRYGTSRSDDESHRRGVFVQSYDWSVLPKEIGGVDLSVESAWLERAWLTTGTGTIEPVDPARGYTLVIRLSDSGAAPLQNTRWWLSPVSPDADQVTPVLLGRHFHVRLSELPGDTLVWRIQRFDRADRVEPVRSVGVLWLVARDESAVGRSHRTAGGDTAERAQRLPATRTILAR